MRIEEKFLGQRRAADPAVSSWVSASAGTGKTHVLTDRVMRLLLAGTLPQRILCLTFTKAAAAEMEQRVFDRLGAWTIMPDDQLSEALFTLLGRQAEPGEQALSRRLFARALETPGGLKIQTIHSFCEALLGRFPLEAGLPANFQVMDERTSEELFLDARERVLASDSASEEPRLAALAEFLDEDGFREVMQLLMSERGRLSRLFHLSGGLAGALARLHDTLALQEGEDADTILAGFGNDDNFDAGGLRQLADLMIQSGKRDNERGARIAAWLRDPVGRISGFEDYRYAFISKSSEAPYKSVATAALLKKHPELEDIIDSEIARIVAVTGRVRAAHLLEANQCLLGLAKAMIDAYDGEKHRRARLDYDDLILKTRDLVADREIAPWVLYKMDGGLDHILIDEAQDTNPEQWEIVQSLAEEFFAGSGARALERTIFAVGDPKQSIYSFQRADPAAFAAMQQYFKDRVEAIDKAWRPVELNLSFRSVPAILRLVDKVFAGELARDGVDFSAAGVRHVSERQGQPGLVEVWPLEPPENPPAREPWTLPLMQERSDKASQRLAKRIAAQIGDWLDDGEYLPSLDRFIRAGDIMILVRQRGTVMEELVRALKLRGIPVAGVDRMALREQLAVMDLLALARFLLLPEDDLTLAVVLKGPLLGLDDDDLFQLAYDRCENPLWRQLRAQSGDNPDFAEAYKYLSLLLGRVDFGGPFALLAEILGPLGGRRKILSRLGQEANDPIDELLGRALEFERSHPPSLQGFIAWIGRSDEEVKRATDQQRDEVRIMTVHGAKGLEAPVVFLPDTLSKSRRVPRIFWLDQGAGPRLPLWSPAKNLDDPVAAAVRAAAEQERDEEYHRLLYVAMTRACDRLYVGGWEGRTKAAADCWYNLIDPAIREIGEAVSVADDRIVWRLQDEVAEGPPGRVYARGQKAPSPLPNWALEPPAPEPSPPRPLAPSRPDEAEPATLSPLTRDGNRYRRGQLIHELLQALPTLARDRRAAVGQQHLRRKASDLSEENVDEMVREVEAVIDEARFRAVFAAGSRAEVPISGLVNGQIISGQIDRLVVTDSTVLVIDFKTNRPEPRSLGDTPKIYLKQLAAYRALLQQVYRDKTITCGLLWTNSPTLMAVPDELLDDHAP